MEPSRWRRGKRLAPAALSGGGFALSGNPDREITIPNCDGVYPVLLKALSQTVRKQYLCHFQVASTQRNLSLSPSSSRIMRVPEHPADHLLPAWLIKHQLTVPWLYNKVIQLGRSDPETIRDFAYGRQFDPLLPTAHSSNVLYYTICLWRSYKEETSISQSQKREITMGLLLDFGVYSVG